MSALSVVIPTFNRSEFVCEAVASVLAQTRPVTECIVVDDGSTDDTELRLRAEFGSRIRYIRQFNQGVQAARNTGIAASSTPWVAFLDDDDRWTPVRHQSFGGVLANESINVISGNFRKFSGSWVDSVSHFETVPATFWEQFSVPDRHGVRLATSEFEWTSMFSHYPFWPSTLVVRRKVLITLAGWNIRMDRIKCEDHEFLARLLRVEGLAIVWAPELQYRVHPNNDATDARLNAIGRHDVWMYILKNHRLNESDRRKISQSIDELRRQVHYVAFNLKNFRRVREAAQLMNWSRLTKSQQIKTVIASLPTPLARAAVEMLVRLRKS